MECSMPFSEKSAQIALDFDTLPLSLQPPVTRIGTLHVNCQAAPKIPGSSHARLSEPYRKQQHTLSVTLERLTRIPMRGHKRMHGDISAKRVFALVHSGLRSARHSLSGTCCGLPRAVGRPMLAPPWLMTAVPGRTRTRKVWCHCHGAQDRPEVRNT